MRKEKKKPQPAERSYAPLVWRGVESEKPIPAPGDMTLERAWKEHFEKHGSDSMTL